MSATKSRVKSNDGTKLSVSEQAIKDVQAAYQSEGQDTLVSHAKFIGSQLEWELKTTRSKNADIAQQIQKIGKIVSPPERITVLLVGNHSAGKSSFVNWYIDEHVQKTSEAVETTGITIIRRGKTKTHLKGALTFKTYPHLQELEKIPGLAENIQCEVSVSNEKLFPLVDFIDTPGLTDGSLAYPFDVNEVIFRLAEYAHLVLVFLDPHKQALCRRTMDVVKRLGDHYSEKMKFFLARSDVLKSEQERQEVLTQCIQELGKNLHVTHGFKLRTIYLPQHKSATSGPNQIEELCGDIQKEIESRIQDFYKNWKSDCELLQTTVNRGLERNEARRSATVKAMMWKATLSLLLVTLIIGAGLFGLIQSEYVSCSMIPVLAASCVYLRDIPLKVVLTTFAVLAIPLLVAFYTKTRTYPTLASANKKKLVSILNYLDEEIKRQDSSVKRFMEQCI